MINKILENIKSSDLSEEKQAILIQYAINIHNNNCPVLFDTNQILLICNIDDNLQNFVKENSNRYFIEKSNNSSREVWQPSYKVKEIQRWILKNILENIEISDCAHGFVKEKSILTNAKTHIHEGEFWVFSSDIKNFFPSISVKKIEEIFGELGYSLEVSKALSLLCTVDGALVQGFPTSPTLSNIVMRKVDREFKAIADRYHLKYSRYADDITFSGNQTNGYLTLVKKLEKWSSFILENANFKVNESKTRLMKNKHTKIVTGLIVDSEGVRIPKKYIRKLAKEIYYCEKFGVNEHLKYLGLITRANYKGYLFGLARYIYMVEPDLGAKYIKQLNNLDWN